MHKKKRLVALFYIVDMISVVYFLTPSRRNSGVFILISQSMTKIFPLGDFIKFSSCMSLKYISGVV